MKLTVTQQPKTNSVDIELTGIDTLIHAVSAYLLRRAEEIALYNARLKETHLREVGPPFPVSVPDLGPANTIGEVHDGGVANQPETTSPSAAAPKKQQKKSKTKPKADQEPESSPDPKPEDNHAPKAESTITAEQLRAVIIRAATILGTKETVAILKRVAGVSKVGQVPERKFVDVHAAFVASLDNHPGSQDVPTPTDAD